MEILKPELDLFEDATLASTDEHERHRMIYDRHVRASNPKLADSMRAFEASVASRIERAIDLPPLLKP